MLQKVMIGKLKSNPFRRHGEYPIRRRKVELLKLSINTAEFWGGLVGRPAGDGTVEVAFGHHRLVALMEMYGPDHEIEMDVRDLSNELMLKMMANENNSEYGGDGWVEVETIRATIEAFDKGLIKLPNIGERGPRRKTPTNSLEFSKTSVAIFLGWTNGGPHGEGFQPDNRCSVGFDAIDAIDEKIVNPANLRGLPRYKIEEITRGVRAIRKAERDAADQNKKDAKRAQKLASGADSPAERKRLERRAELHEEQARQHEAVAKSKTEQFVEQATSIAHSGKGQHEEIRSLARNMMPVAPRKKKVPDVDGLADRLAKKLGNILDGDDGLSAQLALLTEFRGELAKESARKLAHAATLLRLRLEKKIVALFDVD